MIYTSHITDIERNNFMQKLSGEVFGPNGLLVEDWDKRFLSGWRSSSRPSLWFIGGRKESTDKLWRKYGLEIGLPFPLPAREPAKHAQADADGCEFYVRDEGGKMNQPCNAPATLVNRLGFRYCASHGEQAQKAIARRDGHMELRTYLPKK